MRPTQRVVQHGRTLYLPSNRHQINGDGLGGILDTFKNLGKGVVSVLTGGMYDISKNRFYVPFSGGQARNLMQGFTNTTTLGLVNTDKFFNSQTMRTIGNVAAGVEAAAVATVGASALMGSGAGAGATGATGATGSTGSVVPSATSLVSNPTALQSANLSYMTGISPSVAAPSTFGSFATAPITGAFQAVPTAANTFGTAVASAPSLLSQIGSGISDLFGKLPSAITTGNQIMQAVNPIVKSLVGGGGSPQSVQTGDPNVGPMAGGYGYGGFMPVTYGDPSQGLIPGGGVMLPAGYASGGGGGMALPMGGPEGGGGEAPAAGSVLDHPAVPYVAVGAAIILAYYLMKK